MKTRLNQAKGLWIEKLDSVVWAYQTTPRVPTKESLFNITFGTKIVIPVEIGIPSTRVDHYEESSNSE